MISPLCGHTENCSDPDFFGLPVLRLQLQLTFLHRCLDTTWKSQQQNTFHGILLLSLLTFVSPLTFSTWSSLTGWLKIPASSLTHLFSFPLSHTHIHIYKRTWLTNSLPYNCSVLILSSFPFSSLPWFRLFFMYRTLVIASKPFSLFCQLNLQSCLVPHEVTSKLSLLPVLFWLHLLFPSHPQLLATHLDTQLPFLLPKLQISLLFPDPVTLPMAKNYLPFKVHWRRQWQPTPGLLPGKSHGQRSLVSYSPWGRQELDTTEQLHFHLFFPHLLVGG